MICQYLYAHFDSIRFDSILILILFWVILYKWLFIFGTLLTFQKASLSVWVIIVALEIGTIFQFHNFIRRHLGWLKVILGWWVMQVWFEHRLSLSSLLFLLPPGYLWEVLKRRSQKIYLLVWRWNHRFQLVCLQII